MSGALRFDAASHRYYVDGIEMPGVTGILADSGLADFSSIPAHKREFALQRGALVHAACEFYDQKDLVEESVDPVILPYLNAYRAFRDDTGFIPELIEWRGYNPVHGFCGMLDRSGTIDLIKCIVDLKCSDVRWHAALQTAAYASFFENPRTFRRFAVELRGDSTYMVDEYHQKDYTRDFGDFACALRVCQLKRDGHKREQRKAA